MMKKLMHPKVYCLVAIAILLLLISYSCKKELGHALQQQDISELSQLKEWYNNRRSFVAASWLSSYEPDWNNVSVTKDGNSQVYTINLKNPRHIFAASRELIPDNAAQFQHSSIMKLVLITNGSTAQVTGSRFMEIIETEKTQVSAPLLYKQYGTLTGAVNFYELNGILSNGWRYQHGKINGRTSSLLSLGLKNTKIQGTNGSMAKLMLQAPVECGSISVPHWRETCVTVGGLEGWGYDGSGGTTTCRWEVYHTTETIYCPTFDDGGGGGVGGGGGGTGTAPGSDDQTSPYNVETKQDGIDLKKKLDCLKQIPDDAGTKYSAILYADLPNNDNENSLLSNGWPGHSFITLTKSNGNFSVTVSFGFYPKKGWKSTMFAAVDSQINDNGADHHEYNASLAANNLSYAYFNAIVNMAIAQSSRYYDLNDYNCTNFAVDVFNAGMDLNNMINPADWIDQLSGVNFKKTPNSLYRTIKQMKAAGNPNAKTTTGNAPTSSSCEE
ncbi:MAG: hypothetical protein J0I41_22400 [Filimonas sp.]|nr:hypothetical protein [Filimonas sp.]